MRRIAEVRRETAETAIRVRLDLDGHGAAAVRTGVPFFEHMLQQVGRHGRFSLEIDAEGDLAVDAHHTVEDVGIVLGQAFRQALGDGRGIARFASLHAPMDDALVLAAVDISGRPYLHYGINAGQEMLGTFPAVLAEEFFRAFVTHAGVTLHLEHLHGKNAHHIIEAAFKGFSIVLHEASRISSDDVPSTKGVL